MLWLLYIYIYIYINEWSLRDDLYSIEEIDCLDINIMNKSLDIKRINLDGDNLLSFFLYFILSKCNNDSIYEYC